jgi:hypothetical protein
MRHFLLVLVPNARDNAAHRRAGFAKLRVNSVANISIVANARSVTVDSALASVSI